MGRGLKLSGSLDDSGICYTDNFRTFYLFDFGKDGSVYKGEDCYPMTFKYNDSDWYAVEQCYQAQKFEKNSKSYEDIINSVDYAVWIRTGNWDKMKYSLHEWDIIKVSVMESIVRAKVLHFPQIQEDLRTIKGYFVESHSFWSKMNAMIWNKILNELRDK